MDIKHAFHYIHFEKSMLIIISGRQHGFYNESLHIRFVYTVHMLTKTHIRARNQNGLEKLILSFHINNEYSPVPIVLIKRF